MTNKETKKTELVNQFKAVYGFVGFTDPYDPAATRVTGQAMPLTTYHYHSVPLYPVPGSREGAGRNRRIPGQWRSFPIREQGNPPSQLRVLQLTNPERDPVSLSGADTVEDFMDRLKYEMATGRMSAEDLQELFRDVYQAGQQCGVRGAVYALQGGKNSVGLPEWGAYFNPLPSSI